VVWAQEAENGETDSGKFFEDREEGWHWYEDPPEPKEEIEEIPPPPSGSGAPAEATSKPLSAAWMREMLPVLRDSAIDNPTNENVAAYFYAQRIMMDKAQVFSDVAQQVVTTDPLLDENLRLPFASAAKVSFLESANDTKNAIVSDLAETAGFWFFFDETCSYCVDQVRPINELAKRHGVTVQVIHKNGDYVKGLDPSIEVKRETGQFETLGVNFTPAVMMVVPPDDYYIISQGFTSYTMLVDRIIAAANQYGLIDQEQYYAANPTAKGILRADQVNSIDEVDWDNAEDWVPFIRGQIAKTYGIDMPSEEDHEE
jgi:conjugal transfer pilus assembly protein TraF